MNLYMFYLGGMVSGCNIEVHDIQFAVGENIESCYKALIERWWGIPEKLHIDCWAEIKFADGYDIQVVKNQDAQSPHLYLVNLGGYADGNIFNERHENILLVCSDEHEAKLKGLHLIQDWPGRHMDKVTDVDSVVNISDVLKEMGYFLTCTQSSSKEDFFVHQEYIPIGKPNFLQGGL